jgi:predicted Fe-S protein YdhL (DUF1289 family)
MSVPHPPMPSPCVSLCRIDPVTGLCQGCLRTLDEIVNWSQAGEDFKGAVWAEIKRREVLLNVGPGE